MDALHVGGGHSAGHHGQTLCCLGNVSCQDMHIFGSGSHASNSIEHVSAALQSSEVFPHARQLWRRTLAYYYLHAQLTAPWEGHSLLAEALAASTTGLPNARPSAFSMVPGKPPARHTA